MTDDHTLQNAVTDVLLTPLSVKAGNSKMTFIFEVMFAMCFVKF